MVRVLAAGLLVGGCGALFLFVFQSNSGCLKTGEPSGTTTQTIGKLQTYDDRRPTLASAATISGNSTFQCLIVEEFLCLHPHEASESFESFHLKEERLLHYFLAKRCWSANGASCNLRSLNNRMCGTCLIKVLMPDWRLAPGSSPSKYSRSHSKCADAS
jgi:hypothetical protein